MMKGRPLERFVKTYFYFSRSERKGIVILLILLFLITLSIPAYKILFPPTPFNLKITHLPGNLPEEKETPSHPENLAPFNPNIASDEKLAEAGFSPKQVRTIRNYLNKGGRFRSAKDLEKIYGLNPELVKELEPFISIPPERKEIAPGVAPDSVRKKEHRPAQVLELNAADSLQLVALYRIGPALSSRILRYRESLGGFISLDQLNEIYGFDPDILFDLQGKLSVDAGLATHINLNTVTIETLKKHPYFKYKLSNAIVNYRNQHGPFKSMDDLKQIRLVNDSLYKLILRYGYIE